jgi:hypothetical protein
MAYMKMGKSAEGKRLVLEQLKIQNEILAKERGIGAWGNRGSVFYDVAVCHALLGGNDALVIQNLDSALNYQFFVDALYGGDPAFNSVSEHIGFQKIKARVEEHAAFRKRAFTKAISNAQATRDLKNLLDR